MHDPKSYNITLRFGDFAGQACYQEEDFSGRVTLRVPRSLHKSLSAKAESEGVSLNQLMVSALSMFNGFAVCKKIVEDHKDELIRAWDSYFAN